MGFGGFGVMLQIGGGVG
uniref:Uncharacterized protein n=1 Tax=Rhizophora mucronata TaxID=61149 RepID=A0A2P2J189_RHIMU